MAIMDVDLEEVMNEDGNIIQGEVESSGRNVTIALNGYEGVASDEIVLVELCKGVARVVIWADKNQEDPTHIISLEGAKT